MIPQLSPPGRDQPPIELPSKFPERNPVLPSGSTLTIGLIAALVGSPLASSPASAEDEPGYEARDYTLFVGLDLKVAYGLGDKLVYDVDGKSVVIPYSDRTETVAIGSLDDVKIRQEAKVSATNVRIGNLKGDRGYTPAADPAREWNQRQAAMVAYQQDAVSRASAAAQRAANNIAPQGNASLQLAVDRMNSEMQIALSTAETSDLGNSTYYATEMLKDLDSALYDAFYVRFEISSEHPIENPYAVVVTHYRPPEDAAAPAIEYLHIGDMPPIGVIPRSIELRQVGFPVGFKVDDFTLHIFSRGRELASNYSEKSMDVSREQALRFLQMEYLQAHKLEDRPAELIYELIPAYVGQSEDWAADNQSVTIQIDENGTPTNLLQAPNSGARLDSRVEYLIMHSYFFPALKNGEPVASEIEFLIRSLFL